MKSFLKGALLALFTSLLPLAARGQALDTNTVAQAGAPAFVQGELLLKFKQTVTDDQINDVFQRGALNLLKHIQTRAMQRAGDIGVTRVATRLPVQQALQALQRHPALEFAQPNWIYHRTASIPTSDALFNSLWGMGYDPLSNPYGANAAEAWSQGFVGSRSVYVGVIDQGIQDSHPDLAANIWTNEAELNGTAGVDDDGDGYVDDIHGWNAIKDNGATFDPFYDDHGTHVAGTIGGAGGNGIGVAGVNWDVTIISGKFLGPDGTGSTADAVQAIDYMTNLKISKGLNIVALNNSWGGGGADPSLLAAMARAAAHDILFVAAAGNEGSNTDAQLNYPSCYSTLNVNGVTYDSVISVTAIDKTGQKADFANYGATTVDLGAPGVAITSTVPTDSYASYNGTSMATPHVTGAIALYAAAHPGATAQEIKNALFASAGDPANQVSSLAAGRVTVTGGRLNVLGFLNTPGAPSVDPALVPEAPGDAVLTAVVPDRSSSKVQLSWPDYATRESGYKVDRYANGASAGSVLVAAAPGEATVTLLDAGLNAETAYSYTVSAYNAAGSSSLLATAAPVYTYPVSQPPYAAFINRDTTTKGSWINKYGSDGYTVIHYATNNPAYVAVSPATHTDWVWSGSTTDTRALQKPGRNDRFIGCWYSAGTFTVDLDFNDSKAHRVAFYAVDWETYSRAMTVEIINPENNTVMTGANGSPLSQSVTSYHNGQYLVYDFKGHVLVRFTWTGGNNATVSGIFFDAAPAAPSAPAALSATATSPTQVALSWEEDSSNATGFRIERATGAGSFSALGLASASARSYTDSTAAPSTTYSYRIIALNNGMESSPSQTVSVTTPAAPPAPPSAPVLSLGSVTRTSAVLKWTNVSNETGYELERSKDKKSWALLPAGSTGATTGADVTTYTDTGLTGNTTYYYRVRATNAAGDSSNSNVLNVRTPAR